jgi:DAK2 domain fusion protein YloV
VTDSAEIALLLRWCDLALTGLGAAREEIDALNVYPVPDGDTGTNLYLTFEAARTALVDSHPQSLVEALTVFAKGALVGARGSSGVILSQLLRAGADQLLRGDPRQPGRLLADTITLAARAAYTAVGTPVEGTILSVARAASDAAQEALIDAPPALAGQMAHVISAAAAAARAALERTPDQLETLRLAGVVDAGGRGLCVVFDAAEEAFTGRRPAVSPSRRAVPLPSPVAPLAGREVTAGPAYEVMYLLDAEQAAVDELRRTLGGLGTSLVVVGGDGLWNVHVHVDDVGAAVEAGIEAGRPYRVRVTHLTDHHEAAPGRCGAPRVAALSHPRGVVAVCAGRGLAALFAEAGAVVVEAGPGRRCSTGDILDAIHETKSDSVIILPNDGATLAVAEAAARAARDAGVRAAVIPSRAQVQGLAAIAVHEPGRSFDDDVVHMTSAAGHARDGAVTIAARDAMTSAGPCREGDVLGVVSGDFAIVGDDLTQTAIGVVERLLSAGGEMLTLVSGDAADAELVRRVASHVEQTRPTVDVVVYAGGQDRYPLLMGVE